MTLTCDPTTKQRKRADSSRVSDRQVGSLPSEPGPVEARSASDLTAGRSGLDDLIRETVALVFVGVPVREAASAVLETHQPDAEATSVLLRRGLMHMTHAHLSAERTWTEPPEVTDDRQAILDRFHVRRPAGAAAREDILRRIEYEAADGRRKSLIDFTIADLDLFEKLAQGQAAGWRRRAQVIRKVAAEMRARQADTLADLPADRLDAVRAAVTEAWR